MAKPLFNWIKRKPRALLALVLYPASFLAFLITLVIWGYQGIGYLIHGSWVSINLGHLVQWMAPDGYLQLTIYSPGQWKALGPDHWLILNKVMKWLFQLPVSLVTLILGVIGWGVAAAADETDRFQNRDGTSKG